MKCCLLTIILFLSLGFSAQAYDVNVQVTGRFYAHDEDSLYFIKEQLRFNAFIEVITQELKKMGMNAELFWQKFDGRFEEYFAPVLKQLEAKYNITDKNRGDISSKKMKQFRKELRLKRANLRSKFGRLSRIIKSFSIIKMSRSPQYPNSRYMNIRVKKINRELLSSIYFKFTNKGEMRHLDHLYLSCDFTLKNMDWSDLGVEVKSEFTEVVKEYWIRWLRSNLKSHIQSVVVVNDDLKERLQNYTHIKKDRLHGLTSSTEGQDDSLIDDMDRGDFYDSLWMNIKITLKKINENKLLKYRTIEIAGEYIVMDLKNLSLISNFDYSPKNHKYSYKDHHKLSSNLASQIYNLPLVHWGGLKKRLSRLLKEINVTKLSVNNIDNIKEPFALMKLLTVRGGKLQIVPTIDTYTGRTVKIDLNFRGERKLLVNFLRSLNRTPLGKNKYLSLSPDSPFFLITLKKRNIIDKKID